MADAISWTRSDTESCVSPGLSCWRVDRSLEWAAVGAGWYGLARGGFVLAGILRLWGLSLVVEQTIADR